MLIAWQHLEEPEVLPAFVKAVLSRLRFIEGIVEEENEPVFAAELNRDDTHRRRFLDAIFPIMADNQGAWSLLLMSRHQLVLSQDAVWLVQTFDNRSEPVQQMISYLVKRLARWLRGEDLDEVRMSVSGNPQLAEALIDVLGAIELESKRADDMESGYLAVERPKQTPQSSRSIDQIITVLSSLLDEIDRGNTEAWWRVCAVLISGPDGHYQPLALGSDLTMLPNWKTISNEMRERVVAGAKLYILEQNARPELWLAQNKGYFPAMAGYGALRLLMSEDPQFVNELGSEVWKAWAPIIVEFPCESEDAEEPIHDELVQMAYHNAGDEVVKTLLAVVDRENGSSHLTDVLDRLSGCWDSRPTSELLKKAQDPSLKAETVATLLEPLVERSCPEARVFAESLVSSTRETLDQCSRAVVAAEILVRHAPDAGWHSIWPALQEDDDFADKLTDRLADLRGVEFAAIGIKLCERQIADYYLWLVRKYHYKSEVPYGLAAAPEEWRDSVLRHLVRLGTQEATDELQRVVAELPHLTWLRRQLAEAERIMLTRTWVPPAPSDVLGVISSSSVRLVRNGQQLLDVLMEALEQIERELHGHTPMVQFLWDRTGQGKWRPKEENSLSDWIKSRLEDKLVRHGVILNREVEIRSGRSGGTGEETDIHVDVFAMQPDSGVFQRIKAIVEVKGCWNDELDEAMESQLVNRYLKDSDCQHGIYLIGWFNCDHWDDGDYRNHRAQKITLDVAREKFAQQSRDLSAGGMDIRTFVMNTALRGTPRTSVLPATGKVTRRPSPSNSSSRRKHEPNGMRPVDSI